jgi:hypothetical protein
MTIKSRIARLESGKSAEPLIVLFNTIYQNEDESDGDETGRAVIIWGPGLTATIERLKCETSTAWHARLDAIAAVGPGHVANEGVQHVTP